MLNFISWLNEQKQYGKHHTLVFGKMRIPTLGHKSLVDKGREITRGHGGTMSIGLSGADKPLSTDHKKSIAQKLFKHPVEIGDHTKNIISALSHAHQNGVHHIHIVAGSDRANEYSKLINQYNGKPDKKGKIPFHFKSATVHKVGEDRQEGSIDKHPTLMSHKEKMKTVSASRIEKYAHANDHNAVGAYYPHMKSHEVAKLIHAIRNPHKD